MKKFEAYYGWRVEITEIDVERETDQSVFVKGRRRAKVTERECIFDTYDDAKTWLMERAADEIESARRELELAHAKFGNIKGMRQQAE